MAALIAFYSRAGENYFGGAYRRIAVGNTEKAAEMLADLTGGELYKIQQAQPYSEDYQTCIAEAKANLQRKARPEVRDLPEDLDVYDEIYLGYPNYWGTMPMAVYTFLEHYDLTGKTIHPFCTHEGSGLSRTVQDIQKAAPGAAVTKGLALHGSSVDSARAALEQWVREVENEKRHALGQRRADRHGHRPPDGHGDEDRRGRQEDRKRAGRRQDHERGGL